MVADSYYCSNATDLGGVDSPRPAGCSRNFSPGCTSAEPATTSNTAWLLRGPHASRQGRRLRRTARTEPLPSRKTTSTGKRTKHVWTELQGTSSRPASEGSGRRNCSPASRDQKPAAIFNWTTDGLAGCFTHQTPSASHAKQGLQNGETGRGRRPATDCVVLTFPSFSIFRGFVQKFLTRMNVWAIWKS